jgi:hypothetical protein
MNRSVFLVLLAITIFSAGPIFGQGYYLSTSLDVISSETGIYRGQTDVNWDATTRTSMTVTGSYSVPLLLGVNSTTFFSSGLRQAGIRFFMFLFHSQRLLL